MRKSSNAVIYLLDDINWNALEWDRAAEALTWEELLGLDGSLVFLEHVYWVTVLNALFIFLFGKALIFLIPPLFFNLFMIFCSLFFYNLYFQLGGLCGKSKHFLSISTSYDFFKTFHFYFLVE